MKKSVTNLDLSLFSDRQRQREDAERVEGDRDFVALGADDRRLEEAVEQVQDDRVVPALVNLPGLFGHLLVKEKNWQFSPMWKPEDSQSLNCVKCAKAIISITTNEAATHSC